MTQSRGRVLKDSGVEWIGQVPVDWKIVPQWSTLRISKDVVGADWDSTQLLSLTKRGIISRDIESGEGKYPESFEGYQLVEPGDMVFCLFDIDETPRTVGMSRLSGMITSAYTRMRVLEGADSRYLEWYFLDIDNFKKLRPFYTGLRKVVTKERFLSMRMALPPIEEQTSIADFLDRETSQIDALIDKQLQLIETLAERRKAVITRAVTKGLDPNVRMNDSGDEWIGKIPAHWVQQTFRRIGQLESGADYKEFEVDEGGYPVIGSGGEFRRVSKFMFEGESVLFGRKGTIDKPLYVNCAFWTVDTMYWTKLSAEVVAKFVYYWATTLPFNQFTTNTALPSMTSSDIKNFNIALPPKNEQLQISNFLDDATKKIDLLSSKALSMIEVLRERRQALISAAVTGKIDVRGA